ncbi:12294_t:CDS:2, partial [Ambispora leptoticha]
SPPPVNPSSPTATVTNPLTSPFPVNSSPSTAAPLTQTTISSSSPVNSLPSTAAVSSMQTSISSQPTSIATSPLISPTQQSSKSSINIISVQWNPETGSNKSKVTATTTTATNADSSSNIPSFNKGTTNTGSRATSSTSSVDNSSNNANRFSFKLCGIDEPVYTEISKLYNGTDSRYKARFLWNGFFIPYLYLEMFISFPAVIKGSKDHRRKKLVSDSERHG